MCGVAVGDLDAAEMRALERPQELVVVAGDVDDARALAALAQQLLDHVIVRLRPVPGAAQPPAVDDVADQIDRLGVVVAQEIEQELGLRRLRAEMDVGDEQRTEFAGCVASHAPIEPFLLPSLCPEFMQQMCDGCGRRARLRYSPAVRLRGGSASWISASRARRRSSARRAGASGAAARWRSPRRAATSSSTAATPRRSPPPRRKSATASASTVTEVLGDVSQPDIQAELLAACPSPDILVNNNGGPPRREFRDLTRQAILDGVTQNMITPIELIKAVIDGMAERGFGRIVNITSLSVYVPIPGLDVSSGARAGLTSFLAGVARTVAERNVTINNLLPGKLDTDRLRGALSEGRRRGRVQGQARRRHSGQAPRHRRGIRPDLRLLLLGPCRLSDRPEHSGRRRALYQRILSARRIATLK